MYQLGFKFIKGVGGTKYDRIEIEGVLEHYLNVVIKYVACVVEDNKPQSVLYLNQLKAIRKVVALTGGNIAGVKDEYEIVKIYRTLKRTEKIYIASKRW